MSPTLPIKDDDTSYERYRRAEAELAEATERDGTGRVLFAIRPPITESAAIRTLLGLGLHVRCYDAAHTFHVKSYILCGRERTSAVVGSANLSASALTSGREWCLVGTDDELPIGQLRARRPRADYEKVLPRPWDNPPEITT